MLIGGDLLNVGCSRELVHCVLAATLCRHYLRNILIHGARSPCCGSSATERPSEPDLMHLTSGHTRTSWWLPRQTSWRASPGRCCCRHRTTTPLIPCDCATFPWPNSLPTIRFVGRFHISVKGSYLKDISHLGLLHLCAEIRVVDSSYFPAFKGVPIRITTYAPTTG